MERHNVLEATLTRRALFQKGAKLGLGLTGAVLIGCDNSAPKVEIEQNPQPTSSKTTDNTPAAQSREAQPQIKVEQLEVPDLQLEGLGGEEANLKDLIKDKPALLLIMGPDNLSDEELLRVKNEIAPQYQNTDLQIIGISIADLYWEKRIEDLGPFSFPNYYFGMRRSQEENEQFQKLVRILASPLYIVINREGQRLAVLTRSETTELTDLLDSITEEVRQPQTPVDTLGK